MVMGLGGSMLGTYLGEQHIQDPYAEKFEAIGNRFCCVEKRLDELDAKIDRHSVAINHNRASIVKLEAELEFFQAQTQRNFRFVHNELTRLNIKWVQEILREVQEEISKIQMCIFSIMCRMKPHGDDQFYGDYLKGRVFLGSFKFPDAGCDAQHDSLLGSENNWQVYSDTAVCGLADLSKMTWLAMSWAMRFSEAVEETRLLWERMPTEGLPAGEVFQRQDSSRSYSSQQSESNGVHRPAGHWSVQFSPNDVMVRDALLESFQDRLEALTETYAVFPLLFEPLTLWAELIVFESQSSGADHEQTWNQARTAVKKVMEVTVVAPFGDTSSVLGPNNQAATSIRGFDIERFDRLWRSQNNVARGMCDCGSPRQFHNRDGKFFNEGSVTSCARNYMLDEMEWLSSLEERCQKPECMHSEFGNDYDGHRFVGFLEFGGSMSIFPPNNGKCPGSNSEFPWWDGDLYCENALGFPADDPSRVCINCKPTWASLQLAGHGCYPLFNDHFKTIATYAEASRMFKASLEILELQPARPAFFLLALVHNS